MTSATDPDAARDPDRAEPVVRAESLTREYRRGRDRGGLFRRPSEAPTVRALSDVSLAVGRGEVVGVSGPSGSGKSTLLHLLAALDTPTAGRVWIGDDEVSALSERRRARVRLERVGIVFQHFYLLPSLSARANVALPLIERGVGARARRDRATRLLERVGLGDRVDHRPGELSGGEQQRVAIARALANDPDLLVADEPTGEVDSETGRLILELFREFAVDRAVVLASHDPEAIAAADRLVRLRDGRIVEGATAPAPEA